MLERGSEIIDTARRSKDAAHVVDHLLRLIGLGEGLTPAGDDFLVGVLAGSTAFLEEERLKNLLAGEIPSKARGRTTDVSYRMLTAACSGEFDEAMVRVVEALGESSRDVRGPAIDLLAVGASSGANMLAGLLFCVDRFLGDSTCPCGRS